MTPAAATETAPAALEGLDEDQRAAVLAEGPTVVVLAAAGSGKTRVLTRRIVRRIADGSASPRHVLALTFTRRAAGELRHRLARLGDHEPAGAGSPAVHTFHALGASLLQRRWLDRGERPWDVTRDRPDLLRAAMHAAGVGHLDAGVLGAELERATAVLLDPDAYERTGGGGADGRGLDPGSVAAAWRAYEDEKRRRRVLDVDDLVSLPVRLLEAEPAFAGARTWWHRHLFVDEAQDLNPVQLRLLRLLVGPEPDLFLVGDPDQAVYGWNGSDPGLLLELAAGLPSGAVVRLRTNHRSTAPIVAAAASVLASPTAPAGGAGDHTRWPLPAVVGHEDDAAEALATARLLREARWRGQRAWSSMAVLARTRAQLDVVAVALAREGIPHRLPGSLLERPEVLEVLQGLRAVDDRRGLPVRRLAADLPELVRQVLAAAAVGDPASGPDGAPDLAPDPGGDEGEADPASALRRAHLDALVDLVAEFCQAVPTGDLSAFRAWSRGVLGARGGEAGFDRRGVTLTTFHRAKGLEWAVVVAVGVETGLVPHRRSVTPAAVAEERRLAYVAASRAVEELHLSWARRRTTPWGVRTAGPSPFLADVGAAVAPPAVPEPVAAAARLAGLRAARASLRAGRQAPAARPAGS